VSEVTGVFEASVLTAAAGVLWGSDGRLVVEATALVEQASKAWQGVERGTVPSPRFRPLPCLVAGFDRASGV
jgi:hypothetical protein